METLIELFDRRPLENILGAEMFRPRRIVYICPEFVARDAALHRRMRLLFRRRGLQAELIFFKADMYNADAVLALLRSILERYPDCAMDITGGTDDVLFAAGLLSAETSIPVFTYSRRKNCFYNIRNADFAELYRPFDELMFLADNGGGDQFTHVPGGTPNEIFVWDHETAERRRVAGSLEAYLRRRAAGDGDDWYR